MSELTGFRISPQQAAIWRARRGRVDHPYWSVLQLAVDFAGELAGDFAIDEALLAERLAALGAREEILRTRLASLAGMAQPIQVIGERAALALDIEDLRALPAADQAQALAAWRTPPAHAGLPGAAVDATPGATPDATPDTGPGETLSVVLARLDASRWVLTLRAPAWVADGASLRLLAAALLAPAGTGDEETLQYADYAAWKHSLLEAEPPHPGVLYWRQQQADAGVATSLELPRAMRADDFAPATVDVPLASTPDAPDAPDALDALAARLGCTLEDLLLAAWLLLLARLSGQTTLDVACVDAGRGEGLDAAIGAYAQAMPVRATADPARSLAAQVDDIVAARRQAVAWQDYYDSSTDLPHAFAFRGPLAAPRPATVLHERSVDQRFVLRLECMVSGTGEAGDRVRCALAYDGNTMSETAIACLAEQWRLLLDGLSRDPDQAVGRIALHGDVQGRITAPPGPVPAIEAADVVTLIERQAARAPRAPATADGTTTLDYDTLNRRANQLARHLQQQGVAPGDVVGVLLPRGHDMVIAILGVLKAGAAYLPLDPTYPADRLALMVQDSGVQHVVSTTAHALAAAPALLCLDALAPALAALPSGDLALARDREQPAYLIYTSGSTGAPKAVEVSHGNLGCSTQVRMAWYPTPVRAYLLLSSFAFDSSVAGIFWTLAQGGLLVLPASGDELALDTLVRLIQQYQVSHGLCLPSLYQALLDYAEPARLASLDTWIVAGEACPTEVVARHEARLPRVRLVNEYGPTEATVWATAGVLDAESTALGVSIGRPIPGMDLWLLNAWGVPAAVGEPGEIHLGGPALARGYRGQPEQTAAAFPRHPDTAGGARVYRTGDVARWRVDGRLAFVGRRDQQVKIRGHRVELAELERHLHAHDQVREAAVVAQAHAGSTRLVAYVTGAQGSAPDAEDLRGYLSARLPSYMVPAAFVRMPLLPRGANGKVDVQALPDADAAGQERGPYVAPRSALETQLAAICAEVLGLPRVGVEDNFFQIGGDSILSLQVVTRAGQRGIRLTAKQVFDQQTVAAMAAVATCEESARFALDTHWQQTIEDPRALDAVDLAAARYHMDVVEVCAAVLYRCLAADAGHMMLDWVQEASDAARAGGMDRYVTRHVLGCDETGWPAVAQAAKTGMRQLAERDGAAADASVEVQRSADSGAVSGVDTDSRAVSRPDSRVLNGSRPDSRDENASRPVSRADSRVLNASRLDSRAENASRPVSGATSRVTNASSAAPDPAWPGRAPIHLLATVAPDRLTLAWSADGRQVSPDRLRALAERFAEALGDLSAHCAATGEQQLSAMDFPSAGLDQDALQDLLAELAGAEPSQPE